MNLVVQRFITWDDPPPRSLLPTQFILSVVQYETKVKSPASRNVAELVDLESDEEEEDEDALEDGELEDDVGASNNARRVFVDSQAVPQNSPTRPVARSDRSYREGDGERPRGRSSQEPLGSPANRDEYRGGNDPYRGGNDHYRGGRYYGGTDNYRSPVAASRGGPERVDRADRVSRMGGDRFDRGDYEEDYDWGSYDSQRGRGPPRRDVVGARRGGDVSSEEYYSSGRVSGRTGGRPAGSGRAPPPPYRQPPPNYRQQPPPTSYRPQPPPTVDYRQVSRNSGYPATRGPDPSPRRPEPTRRVVGPGSSRPDAPRPGPPGFGPHPVGDIYEQEPRRVTRLNSSPSGPGGLSTTGGSTTGGSSALAIIMQQQKEKEKAFAKKQEEELTIDPKILAARLRANRAQPVRAKPIKTRRR
ncbi:hypothetical protein GNI_078240 [Gregarina niphandrodes]|uniref:Uncharacterized protein n=1 Tax=Gregarina niphandrodes TaxID=110365 RepID=A0A023B6L5_GRENI|nr:hypothetical protein GNI_078240 [Gregarina niphandrodes]EZG66630.1 hypothetical protein GNI_078240 [Gregarina niphandrodes]|eukprot:XP_011130559.1 hypothetical protein GNI_078240 [Gregarina niphandrodes]